MRKKIKIISALAAMTCAAIPLGVACGESTDDSNYSFMLGMSSVSLDRYEYAEINAEALKNGERVSLDEVNWSVQNPSVASVKNGRVYASGIGSTTVSGTYGGVTETFEVSVTNKTNDVPTLQVQTSALGFLVGDETYELETEVLYHSLDTSDAVYTYTIEDTSVATISKDGVITVGSVGETTLEISATWNGYTGDSMKTTVDIRVNENVEASVTGGADEIYLLDAVENGKTYSTTTAFKAQVFVNMVQLTDPTVTWRSTNEAVATVSGGVVTAVSAGDTQIYYTYEQDGMEYVSRKHTVKVSKPVLDRTATVSLDFNKDITYATTKWDGANWQIDTPASATVTSFGITATSVFGDALAGNITAVYDSEDTETNLYDAQTGKLNLEKAEYGERTYIVYNEKYAYAVKATVITKVLSTNADLLAWVSAYDHAWDIKNMTANTYFVLDGDISGTATISMGTFSPWPGVSDVKSRGSANKGFQGTFDGRGYTISGYKFGLGGLFGALSKATIKNLKMENVSTATSFTNSGRADIKSGYSSLLANSAYNTTIENCDFEYTLTATKYHNVGLFYRAVGGTVKNCVFACTNNDAMDSTGTYAGALMVNYKQQKDAGEAITFENAYVIHNGSNTVLITDYEADGKGTATLWHKTLDGVTALVPDCEGVALNVGDKHAFVVDGYDGIEWHSTNESVASVSGTGEVTAVGAGGAQVYFTFTVGDRTYASQKWAVSVTSAIVDLTASVNLEYDTASTLAAFEMDSSTGRPAAKNYGAEAVKTKTNFAFSASDLTGFEGTITGVYDSEALATNVYANGNIDLTGVAYGERVFHVTSSNGKTYQISVLVITKVIDDEQDLLAFTNALNTWNSTSTENMNAMTGHYYVLGADVVNTGKVFTSYIATSCHSMWPGTTEVNARLNDVQGFSGTFDGRGYQISGYTFGIGGLFGQIVNGTVKNLAITNASLAGVSDNPYYVSSSESGGGYSSVLAQIVAGATIDNCYFEYSWTHNYNDCGLIYVLHKSTMTNCVISANVTTTASRPSNLARSTFDVSTLENVLVVTRGEDTALICSNPNNDNGKNTYTATSLDNVYSVAYTSGTAITLPAGFDLSKCVNCTSGTDNVPVWNVKS